MINTQNYKNQVNELWEEYKNRINKIKLDIKNVRDNINLSDEGKRKNIDFLRERFKVCNGDLGNKLIQCLEEGIEYINNKSLKPIDTKELLNIIELLKASGDILSDDEILSLTKEFQENAIAIKTINSVLSKNVLKELPFSKFIKNIEVAKAHIQQAIDSSENDEQGIMMPFQGWEINCQVVEVSINNIPDKL